MPTLIILRHGQSIWNLENKFTGEVDIDLSTLGKQEAITAGKLLKNYTIELAYTSVLKRAIHTLDIVLHEMKVNIPIVQSAALNERNYGDLQGLDKTETAKKYGEDKVLIWRRSYDTAPPNGESLEDTFNRVIPFYKTKIEPQLKAKKNILIVAHGNSLRALMMYLDGYNAKEIADINIPTGIPRVYKFSTELLLESVEYIEE
jgi:2,3-bisphosphoglycerate-dependent phosphoglycerate mutase